MQIHIFIYICDFDMVGGAVGQAPILPREMDPVRGVRSTCWPTKCHENCFSHSGRSSDAAGFRQKLSLCLFLYIHVFLYPYIHIFIQYIYTCTYSHIYIYIYIYISYTWLLYTQGITILIYSMLLFWSSAALSLVLLWLLLLVYVYMHNSYIPTCLYLFLSIYTHVYGRLG